MNEGYRDNLLIFEETVILPTHKMMIDVCIRDLKNNPQDYARKYNDIMELLAILARLRFKIDVEKRNVYLQLITKICFKKSFIGSNYEN